MARARKIITPYCRPQYQISRECICLPIQVQSTYDGDTHTVVTDGGTWDIRYTPKNYRFTPVEISFPGGMFSWQIRLLECWCPETDEPGGTESTERAKELIGNSRWPALWIPVGPGCKNPLRKLVSLQRMLAHIYLTKYETLSRVLVKENLATVDRQPGNITSPAKKKLQRLQLQVTNKAV